MKRVLICLSIATSLFANIDVIGLDIYKNGNFVKQKLDLKDKSTELLSNVSIEDIKFQLDNNCKVNSFDIEKKDFQNDELSKMISELEEKIALKENRIKALNSSNSFLEKSSLSSISNTKTLEESSSFVKKEILANYNEIYKIEGYIKEEKNELAELNKKRTAKNSSFLNYDISCNSDVFITYPIFELSKNGFFDINYDTKAKKIELKNSIYLTQTTGYDLKNIEVNFYTFNFNNQIKPIKFYPQYIDIQRPIAYDKAEVAMSAAPRNLKMQAAPVSTYLENSTNSFFNVSNVNLTSGKKTEITLSLDKFNATDSIEIDGFSSSQAFYKVDFKSDKLLSTQGSKLFLDGVYIGRANFDEIKKDKESSIYFSTNRLIDVKKELLKDMKEEPFFSINKLKTEKIYSYEITNNSSKKFDVTLVERVPVSKHEDIKIELIGKSKYSVLENNGKIYYDLKLEPNETKTIEFGYSIEKPNNR